jgi:hypothetical protein
MRNAAVMKEQDTEYRTQDSEEEKKRPFVETLLF